jgi:hypothetical protein
METRECASCGAAKPVSHVWYAMAEKPASFLCGSCFHEETGPRSAGLAH